MAEVNSRSSLHQKPLNDVLDAVVADLTDLKLSIVNSVSDLSTIRAAVNVAISKLNADGGVSDTDYALVTALNINLPTTLTTTVD